VNLGNPEEFTVLELAQLIIQLTGSGSKIIRKWLPADDPERRKPDISLAKSTLDWSLKVQLEEGITKTKGFFLKTCFGWDRRPVNENGQRCS
jgi:UDP-glucuronate decarboxylase